MSLPSASSRFKGGVNALEGGVRANCTVVSWGDEAAYLVMHVENPRGGNPLCVPVTYYPKAREKHFKIGEVVRVTIAKKFNMRTRKVEVRGHSLRGNPNDYAQEVPYETAVRLGIVSHDEKGERISRQRLGPAVSPDGVGRAPVKAMEREFKPVATKIDALDKTGEAASPPKVEEPVDIKAEMGHDCSGIQIEEPSDDNLAKGLTFCVEGKTTAKQIAEPAVGALMRKFLKYDEMAVEVMFEGFQKKLLGMEK